MKKGLTKYWVYIAITLILLTISGIYKFKISILDRNKKTVSEEIKSKKIVTLWLIDGPDSETRKYQIDKFNRENKDIYIDFQVYKEDYFNLLRMALASNKKVDIFQYGFYEMLRNSNLMNISDLGLNKSLIDEKNLMYFEGKPFGTKIFGNNIKVLWNKEIFKSAGLDPETPPKTWEELINYAKIIKARRPDIVPFEFPASTWGEVKSSIGEIAANQGTIYTSFWNYKTGVYDFSYAKDILELYNYIYTNALTAKDIEKKSSIDVRADFYDEDAAMIISTYEDKKYYSNIIPLNFSVGITDLPKLKPNDTEKYFFNENYTTLVVNNNISDKKSVKEVYEWLLSENVNRELLLTSKVLPTNINNTLDTSDKYQGYNDTSKFTYETFDPTIYTNYNPEESKQLFIDAIKGKEKIDSIINTLNLKYDNYYKSTEKDAGLDFSKYTIK